jgi:hypothetical protein
MILDFSTRGEVIINMVTYLDEMRQGFGKDLSESANTPAAAHLFQVREDAEKLSEDKAKKFHHTVAQGLFLSKRSRVNILTTIAFFATRVKEPDVDDWKKLVRMMRYLNKTKTMVRRLKASGLNCLRWYIVGAHTVHDNLKGHTGGCLGLDQGSLANKSTKQKLNTRSSTETEIVSVDDVMPDILWHNLFLEEQGYKATNTIVHQDNMSTMLWEKNGRQSVGKRAKQINVRYFFIKDRIDKGEMEIKHCPTDDMIADFFTKPL